MSRASHHTSCSGVDDQRSPSTDVIPVPTHPPPIIPSATSGKMSDGNSDPSQLQFYPPSVCDIIEHAKQISHCDIAVVNSFPLCADFNSKASEYMYILLIACKNQGLIYVAVHKGWWLHYATSIMKLLWEDLGNWCSSLKKKACFFVHEHYEWGAQNHCDVNAGIARQLLEHSNFLKDGFDEEGHTNNLAHLVLSALIIEFFYTGANAIANLFPEVFQSEVPCTSVALAMTTIKVALDEVIAKGKDVTFKQDIYVDVYVDILGLMSKCNTSLIHCAKTKACHVQGAKIGKNGGSSGTATRFDVDLD
ncbi:hypothetical protein EDC04DRAFT_2892470 [Pisolithus marmoratus]|nr:hypothetical protein EDC04DRAFT_2892470 [Pisolithus marmoratus]